MKKQLIIVGIMLVLLAVGFSGCTSEQEGAKTEIGDENQLNGDQSVEGKIIFGTTTRTLHVINPDGSDEINLGILMYYGLSENSKQILLLGEDGIYTINADGTGQLELIYSLNLSNLNIRSYPSQNFEKIVVYENDSYYVSDIDGNNKVKISISENDQARDITLSPTGEKVASLTPLDPEDFYEDDYNLYIINSDGTGKKSIAQCSEADYSPYKFGLTFSPDESKITYNHENEFHIIDADGSNDYLLDYGPYRGTEPAWSSDSKKIAYHTKDGIYIINIDGTGKTLIKTIDTGYQSVYGLCWEPNAERIAYSIQENFDSDPKIYVGNVDGSGSNHIAYGAYPKWSSS